LIPLLIGIDSVEQNLNKSVSIEKKLIKDNNTHTILVVDDEDSVRLVLSKSLEVLGYKVLTAENGSSALEIFNQVSNEISLVVMDMIMPNMPGQELFFALKRINNEVKVLISSGYASDHNIQLLLENGALGLIQKPFSVDELGEKIKEVLNYE
jgi:DNA-binding NtrC family response regulator